MIETGIICKTRPSLIPSVPDVASVNIVKPEPLATLPRVKFCFASDSYEIATGDLTKVQARRA